MREWSSIQRALRLLLVVLFFLALSYHVPGDFWGWLQSPRLDKLPAAVVLLKTGLIFALGGTSYYFVAWAPVPDWGAVYRSALKLLLALCLAAALSYPLWKTELPEYAGWVLSGVTFWAALGVGFSVRSDRNPLPSPERHRRDEVIDFLVLFLLIVLCCYVWLLRVHATVWSQVDWIDPIKWAKAVSAYWKPIVVTYSILTLIVASFTVKGSIENRRLMDRADWVSAIVTMVFGPIALLIGALKQWPDIVGPYIFLPIMSYISLAAIWLPLRSGRLGWPFGVLVLSWLILAAVLVLFWRRNQWESGVTSAQFQSDEAVRSTDQDRLLRRQMARALVRAVDKAPIAEPFVIGLYGSWGTGKTSVMNMARKHAGKKGHLTLWLNAWMYDDKSKIARAFLQSLTKLLRQYHLPVFSFSPLIRFSKLAAKILKSPSGNSVITRPVEAVVAELPAETQLSEVKDQVTRLIQRVAGPGNKLVVFVDDLDRCSTTSILGTLEFMNEMADFGSCVWVLGLDREATVTALSKHHGASGATAIHKVINVTLELDTPHEDLLVTMFLEQFRDLLFFASDKVAQKHLKLVIDVVGHNPRQIKQLLNRISAMYALSRPLPGKHQFNRVLMYWELLHLTYPDISIRIRQRSVLRKLKDLYDSLITDPKDDEIPDVPEPWVAQMQTMFSPPDLRWEDARRLGQLLAIFLLTVREIDVDATISLLTYKWPGDLEEIECDSIIDDLSDIARGKASLTQVIYRNGDNLRPIVNDLVHLKNHHLRHQAQQSAATKPLFEFDNQFFRNIIVEVAQEVGKRRRRDVFTFHHLVSLIRNELECSPDRKAVPFICRLVESGAWDPIGTLALWKQEGVLYRNTSTRISNLKTEIQRTVRSEFVTGGLEHLPWGSVGDDDIRDLLAALAFPALEAPGNPHHLPFRFQRPTAAGLWPILRRTVAWVQGWRTDSSRREQWATWTAAGLLDVFHEAIAVVSGPPLTRRRMNKWLRELRRLTLSLRELDRPEEVAASSQGDDSQP
ncbi:MAG TPA: P-loop NTPase fold protein [Symbiobacteriaceae bacterium]|nr:P-loop NTPase fold protein [Symbiobacteriaceae bacterium]